MRCNACWMHRFRMIYCDAEKKCDCGTLLSIVNTASEFPDTCTAYWPIAVKEAEVFSCPAKLNWLTPWVLMCCAFLRSPILWRISLHTAGGLLEVLPNTPLHCICINIDVTPQPRDAHDTLTPSFKYEGAFTGELYLCSFHFSCNSKVVRT